MSAAQPSNVYLPHLAVIEEIQDEIQDVKTFFWRFQDPGTRAAFKEFMPGQFMMLSVFGAGEIAVSMPPSPTEDRLFFTVRSVGSVTRALHALRPGAVIGVRGPYGNGFPMREYRGRNLVFVAGGIGLIPLRSCIVYALHRREEFGSIQVFYGARTPRDLMYAADLARWRQQDGFACRLTVDLPDEHWTDHVGVVGSLLKLPDAAVSVENTTVIVCGPPVMFRFTLRDLRAMGFKDGDIVSTLERYMKCGVGKCGHCCIGVAYVCTDGPVFTYEQIRRLGEVI
jgi:NAD(P)H-flavin reductase